MGKLGNSARKRGVSVESIPKRVGVVVELFEVAVGPAEVVRDLVDDCLADLDAQVAGVGKSSSSGNWKMMIRLGCASISVAATHSSGMK